MASFLEKLKKGMGIEIIEEEEGLKEEAEKEVLEKEKLETEIRLPEKKLKPAPERKGSKKIKVQDEEEPKIEKLKKEKDYPQEETDKEGEPIRQSFALKDLTSQEGQLAVDVYQTEKEIVIQSAIAGVKPQDLDISIEEDFISIKGIRHQPQEKGEKNYFYQECFWGPFSRQIILPEETDPTRAEAEMKDGVLTIRIPKIERKKKRKLEVKLH